MSWQFFSWRCFAYKGKTKEIFKQIPTETPTPTPEYFKEKCQTFLTDIGGELYLNNMHNPKPPMENPRLSNKKQQQEDKLKGELEVACDRWKDWKLQIHWKNWNLSCQLKVYKIIIGWGT